MANIIVKVDRSRFDQRITRALREAELHGREVAKLIGRQSVDEFNAISPRDTNRYVRGWLDAGNKAALDKTWALPVLKKSKMYDRHIVRLEGQYTRYLIKLRDAKKSANYWNTLYTRRYLNINRKGKWKQITLRKKTRADKKVEKLTELVARAHYQWIQAVQDDTVVIIWGRNGNNPLAARRQARAISVDYGGSATWNRNALTLTNKQAHAYIVDSKFKVRARVRATVRPGARARMALLKQKFQRALA